MRFYKPSTSRLQRLIDSGRKIRSSTRGSSNLEKLRVSRKGVRKKRTTGVLSLNRKNGGRPKGTLPGLERYPTLSIKPLRSMRPVAALTVRNRPIHPKPIRLPLSRKTLCSDLRRLSLSTFTPPHGARTVAGR